MDFKTNTFISAIFLVSLYHTSQGQALLSDVVETATEQEPWNKEIFKEEAAQTYNLVFHKYNSQVRPPVRFVEVDLAVTLVHLRHLDIRKQELQTVLNIEADWVDSRLQWIPHKLKSIHSNTRTVWCPDIIYTNGVSPVDSLYPDVVRIMNDGSVRWSRKEIVTTQCRTKRDEGKQHCAIQIGFLSNTRGDNLDRFFSNRSSVTYLDGFGNHDWRLISLEMNVDDNNETKSTTIEIKFTLQSKQHFIEEKNGDNDDSQGHRIIENCTESQYSLDVDPPNKASHLNLSQVMVLLVTIISLNSLRGRSFYGHFETNHR